MPNKRTIPSVCAWCGEHFLAWNTSRFNGGGRYCSRSCAGKDQYPSQQLPLEHHFNEGLPAVRDAGCWEWQGHLTNGYGELHFDRGGREVRLKAHRAAWMLYRGPIPAGLYVRHLCNNPRCVNPAHLAVGTQLENMGDIRASGRPYPGARLTEGKVELLRVLSAQGLSDEAVGRILGVSASTVRLARVRQTWRHVP